MTQVQYMQSRTRIFIVVQSLIAMAIILTYLALVLSRTEVPSDFAFITGLVIMFFFDEVRRNGTESSRPVELPIPPNMKLVPDIIRP